MERIIIIQSYFGEKSLAVLENNQLVEFHTESFYEKKIVGNIYLGRVANVLPGMQAAFVNIGLDRNALLHGDDINIKGETKMARGKSRKPAINDLIKKGQELVVQVVKEGTQRKGPRITTHLSLPGKYVVLMPEQGSLFFSRRIVDEKQKLRVRKMAQSLKRSNHGLIIRTAAQEASFKELDYDFHSLETLWQKIQKQSKKAVPPALLHRDLDLVPALLRDYLSKDISRILVNSEEMAREVGQMVNSLVPPHPPNVILREGDLFELFKVYGQMEQALQRRVWLKCGGYLVIDGTEALTAIDVNTGRFVGTTNLAETILQVNLEAAAEISRQLRLRNLSGMVIVDFIDMASRDHWDLVLTRLKEGVQDDPIKTQVLGVTPLGLVEINRKKTRKSLAGLWLRDCPHCRGRGKILGLGGMIRLIKQKIFSLANRTTAPRIAVKLNSEIAVIFIENYLEELQAQTDKEIILLGRKNVHRETLELKAFYSMEDLNAKLFPLEAGQIFPWSMRSFLLSSTGIKDLLLIPDQENEIGREKAYFEIDNIDARQVQGRFLNFRLHN